MSALDLFSPAARDWFRAAFRAPTPIQQRGWATIASGDHALLLAPTGSGKTLAAFLWCLDRLHRSQDDPDQPDGVRVLYISPLKALVYDVERNLRVPLAGLARAAQRRGDPVPDVRTAMRTGDTPQRERRRLKRNPAQILCTTPESLYLLLSSQSREVLRSVRTVIVDEIHAVAGSKRGVHLALSLERLSALCAGTDGGVDPQRIGLSATQRPLQEIASFLGGDRSVSIVDSSEAPAMDVRVVVPVPDMENPPQPPDSLGEGGSVLFMDGGEDPGIVPPPDQPVPRSMPADRTGIWSTIHPRILDLVQEHRSTIVFVNSRRLCERVAQRVNELSIQRGGDEVARAHHGSVSHDKRAEIEEALKRGDLPCIVATSSLELGIDMGAVDLVVQVESPGSVASGLQRVGRAGHGVGELSRGRIFPKYRGDLLEAAVVVRGMLHGQVERTRVPTNTLDVLAQQIVSMCVVAPRSLGEVGGLVRRAYPFRDLSRDALHSVLDMLSGRMPLTGAVHPDHQDAVPDERGFEEVRPLLNWDRATDRIQARRGARLTVVANPGTIPDRGMYGVFIAPDGPRVGTLDEEMVHEARKGEVFLLGASSWRIVELKRDRVLVAPAPGQPGKMPFWRGEGPGRPLELGLQMGELVRQVGQRLGEEVAGGTSGEDGAAPQDPAAAWLAEHCELDALAAGNLVAYIREQRQATDTLPTDRAITVERFQDELGDWRLCLLSPFGSRVNGPWALAIQSRLEDRHRVEIQVLWTDDGIIIRAPDASFLPDEEELVPDPLEIEDLVTGRLGESAVFASRFRQAAGRALMLPRRRPGARVPLWLQRMKAQNLLASARRHPSYPIVLEAYRECLQDVFDLPGLKQILEDLKTRRRRLEQVETDTPSPFARSLVFAFVATWLYEGDAPMAERRVQALSIDRALLRELLGADELRELLDPEVIAEVQLELQHLAQHRQARSVDGVHDLLRRLGDLSEAELRARCRPAFLEEQSIDDEDGLERVLDQLRRTRRVIRARVGGEQRWLAIEDAGRYRDALGVAPPGGVPAAFLQQAPHAFEALLLRYARTHAPFTAAQVARRWDLVPEQVAAVLRALDATGRLVSGAFLPEADGGQLEFCDPEVMRRIKRRTLARLRGQVEPVEAHALGRFLPAWHGVSADSAPSRPRGALLRALGRLEGCPMPFSEIEGRILPARVPGFQPQLLDELGARGELVWVGCGALGSSDGKVMLLRRGQAPALVDPPEEPPEDPVERAILGQIERRGACFFFELKPAVQDALGRKPGRELEAALWSLVWSGHLTNDTLQPLRALGAPKRRRRRRRSGPRAWGSRRGGSWGSAQASPTGGRWSLVRELLQPAPSDTEKGMARAAMLLERYGIVGREVVISEGLRGGFSNLLPVFYELEETGHIRQGWFVDGLGGAQFAVPGAVDRIRGHRERPEEDVELLVLAATDPAQPYGAIAPWPDQPDTAPTPRREAGATVVLRGGEPVLYVARGRRRLLCFPAARDRRALASAVGALLDSLVGQSSSVISRIDGVAPQQSQRYADLVAAGLEAEGDSLRLAPPL